MYKVSISIGLWMWFIICSEMFQSNRFDCTNGSFNLTVVLLGNIFAPFDMWALSYIFTFIILTFKLFRLEVLVVVLQKATLFNLTKFKASKWHECCRQQAPTESQQNSERKYYRSYLFLEHQIGLQTISNGKCISFCDIKREKER